MHERILRDFFLGEASAAELRRDLEDSLIPSGRQVIRHPIVDMEEDFEVVPEHLVRLCDAVLEGEVEPWMLEPVGFCLVASDHFWWDGDTAEGGRVANAVYDWSAPEINYPLTRETAAKFRVRIATGINTFTRTDTHPPG